MSKSKRGYPMPAVIVPEKARHVCIPVPDDPAHRQAFLGNLLQLARPWSWGEGRTEGDEEVAAVWGNIWLDTALQLDQAYDSCGERVVVEPRCKSYYPFAPFIEFAPASPYDDPIVIPDGYANRPWYTPNGAIEIDWGTTAGDVGTQILLDLLNALDQLEPNDVLSLIPSIPVGWQTLFMGLPRFTVKVRGYGQVQLELMNVILGSRVLVSVDAEFSLSDIIASVYDVAIGALDNRIKLIDTDLDYISVPPETDFTQTEIIEIEEPGEHTIHVTVLPAVNDALIPIGFGAGLRSVTLCGENIEPIYPEGSDPGEGEIIVTDPCGCDSLESMMRKMLLGAAFGIDNQTIINDVVIDDDSGKVIPDKSGKEQPPEVVVPVGFTAQQIAGGRAIRAARELAEAWGYINQWMLETDCWDGLNWLIPLQEACYSYVWNLVSAVYDADQTALNDLMLWYVNNSTASWLVDVEPLAEYFFCVGIYPQAVSRFGVFEKAGEEREFYIRLSKIFQPGQYLYWGALGEQQPINNPQIYGCYINEDAIIEIPDGAAWIAFADSTNAVIHHDAFWEGYPVPRSVSIRAQGSMTFADGTVIDSFYKVATDGTISPVSYKYRYYGASDLAPDSIPAYRSDHQYLWTATVEAKGSELLQMWPDPGEPYESDASATGSFVYTITDLGEA